MINAKLTKELITQQVAMKVKKTAIRGLPCIYRRDGVLVYIRPEAKTLISAYVVGFK